MCIVCRCIGVKVSTQVRKRHQALGSRVGLTEIVSYLTGVLGIWALC